MSSITKTKKERDFHHLSTPWNITFNLISKHLCVSVRVSVSVRRDHLLHR